MKKLALLLSIFCLITVSVEATVSTPVQTNKIQKPTNQVVKSQREEAFEKRLGLTETQKLQAREIRRKGHEKLKPVIEELKNKKQEAKMVKLSRIAVEVQEERLAVLEKDINNLEKKAREIRKANMKEFESILTRQQKKTLKLMKKEGRKRYHEQHPYNKQMFSVPQSIKVIK